MKLIKEHGEELRHTGAQDNVPERGIRRRGAKARVYKAKQPPDTENHAILYRVRWSIQALELKCVALKMKKR